MVSLHDFHYVLAGVVLIAGYAFLFATIGHRRKILLAVNERLPEGQKFNPYWRMPFEWWKIRDAYRRFYPDGQLLRTSWIVSVVGMGMLLSALVIAVAFP